MPKLSICIPTHDGRAEVLDRLLEDLAEQLETGMDGRVEVCVSDNGSRDETTAVLARRRERFPVPLITHRFERNDGFTPNLLKVMEIATGDFCWLLGSDDLIVPGGIAEVLALLEAHPDAAGITLNRFRVNAFEPGVQHLDPASELPADAEHAHVYRSAHEIFAEVGLLHDYISTQVVDRKLFEEVARGTSAAELEQSGHFAHLLLLGRMAQRRPVWLWHPAALVQHTTGTSALDEDLGHDYASYLLTVMEGRDTVWSMLLGRRSPTYKAVMAKAYERSASPGAIVRLKVIPGHTHRGDLALVTGLPRYFAWYPPFWLRSLPFLLAPHSLIQRVSPLHLRLRRLAGRR